MELVFLDSSASVKYYAAEPGRDAVVNLIQSRSPEDVYVAFVTGAEVVAALRRKEQTGAASPDEVSRVVAEFRRDWWGSWTILDANRAVLETAMDLADRRRLRGYDAVQLAFAVVLNSHAARQGDTVTLWSSDTELLAAAQSEELATVDPSHATKT